MRDKLLALAVEAEALAGECWDRYQAAPEGSEEEDRWCAAWLKADAAILALRSAASALKEESK